MSETQSRGLLVVTVGNSHIKIKKEFLQHEIWSCRTDRHSEWTLLSAAPDSVPLNFEKQTATCTFAHRQMGHEEEEARKARAKYFEEEDKSAREVVDGEELKKEVEDEEKHVQDESGRARPEPPPPWRQPLSSSPEAPPAPPQQRMQQTDAKK